MKTTTLLYVAKADDNYSIAREIGASTSAHRGWQITLLFYSAMYWIRAYFVEKEIASAATHRGRLGAIRSTPEIASLALPFRELQVLSEEARYEIEITEAEDLVDAEIVFDEIRSLIVETLEDNSSAEDDSRDVNTIADDELGL